MYRAGQSKPIPAQTKKMPLINLSSDEDSDSQNQKENHCNESIHTHTTAQTIKPVYRSNTLYDTTNQSKNPNPKSNNQMQFSTLSLDENSIVDMDNQIKLLLSQKKELTRENEFLRGENLELKTLLSSRSTENLQREYEEKLEECYSQIQQVKSKYKKLQEDFRRTEKQYENRLINQQLPTKKNINEQSTRLYREMTEKLKEICNRFIEQLSKEKMNAKVESIISNYIQELIQINPKTNNKNPFGQYNSSTTTPTPTPSRYSKVSPTPKAESDSSLNISSDYRLLQKSIEKLKTMQKQIDSSCGSYLKKPQQKDESVIYRSVALDQSSISGLDKSKSKRKRIFQ